MASVSKAYRPELQPPVRCFFTREIASIAAMTPFLRRLIVVLAIIRGLD